MVAKEIVMLKPVRTFAILVAVIAALSARADDAADASALKVMDAFMAAFNARDTNAWADTLLYPHVRFAGGAVTTFADRDAFIAANHIDKLIAGEQWGHSKWDSLEIVQSSPKKVHIAVEFSRYHPDGTRYASYPSLYIVEQIDGRWGIRARSSFAP
jgi:hypothetical protein